MTEARKHFLFNGRNPEWIKRWVVTCCNQRQGGGWGGGSGGRKVKGKLKRTTQYSQQKQQKWMVTLIVQMVGVQMRLIVHMKKQKKHPVCKVLNTSKHSSCQVLRCSTCPKVIWHLTCKHWQNTMCKPASCTFRTKASVERRGRVWGERDIFYTN